MEGVRGSLIHAQCHAHVLDSVVRKQQPGSHYAHAGLLRKLDHGAEPIFRNHFHVVVQQYNVASSRLTESKVRLLREVEWRVGFGEAHQPVGYA